MEDETTKEENQPSTSKKDSQRTNSGNDLYDERERDDVSNSETSVSATYSARSRVDIVDARPEPPKPALGKREPKIAERKKKGRRGGGRVEKRRRSYNRRQVRRAPMRRKPVVRHPRLDERRIREQHSMSTIFTRLSSRSGSRTPGCVHCGHRCCRRRYEYEVIRYEYTRRRCTCRRYRNRKMPKKKIVRAKHLKKKPVIKIFRRRFPAFSKQIQTGSRSHMLSPLFINTNATPEAEVILPGQSYCEVSPEMIFESVCVLNLWRQDVQTELILEYIRRKFPVNNVENELLEELKEKLRIASLVGIVTQTNPGYWALAGELQQRKLTANHVTLFWKAYGDTLRPVHKKVAFIYEYLTENPSEGFKVTYLTIPEEF